MNTYARRSMAAAVLIFVMGHALTSTGGTSEQPTVTTSGSSSSPLSGTLSAPSDYTGSIFGATKYGFSVTTDSGTTLRVIPLQEENGDSKVRLALPVEAERSIIDTQLDRARWLVLHHPDVYGSQLLGLQIAVCQTIGLRPPVPGPDASASDFAVQLLNSLDTFDSVPQDYATGLSISLAVNTTHVQSYDLRASLTSVSGQPISGQTVTLAADNVPSRAQATDNNGNADFNNTTRPGVDERKFTARSTLTISPGAILVTQSGGAYIAEQGIPLSVGSDSLSLPSLSLAHLTSTFSSAFLSDLLTEGLWGFVISLAVLLIGSVGTVVQIGAFIIGHGKRLILGASVALALLGLFFVYKEKPFEPVFAPTLGSGYAGEAVVQVKPCGSVATSTYDASSGQTYSADKALDGDPSTAWVSAPDVNIGQHLDVRFTQNVWIVDIRVLDGLQTNFNGNGRADKIGLTVDGGLYSSYNLDDGSRDEQLVKLSAPVLTSALDISVDQYTPGSYNVALSELVFDGYVASGEDSASIEPSVSDVQPSKLQSTC